MAVEELEMDPLSEHRSLTSPRDIVSPRGRISPSAFIRSAHSSTNSLHAVRSLEVLPEGTDSDGDADHHPPATTVSGVRSTSNLSGLAHRPISVHQRSKSMNTLALNNINNNQRVRASLADHNKGPTSHSSYSLLLSGCGGCVVVVHDQAEDRHGYL